jgi:ABC-type transporter Mla subunit MlaD
VSLLGQLAENAAALTKLSNDAMDLVIRNLRVAGRRDVIRLARQLGRTEDKLERVLQELEEVRDQLRDRDEQARGASSTGASRRARSGGGAPAGSSPAKPSGQSRRASRGGGGHSGQSPRS